MTISKVVLIRASAICILYVSWDPSAALFHDALHAKCQLIQTFVLSRVDLLDCCNVAFAGIPIEASQAMRLLVLWQCDTRKFDHITAVLFGDRKSVEIVRCQDHIKPFLSNSSCRCFCREFDLRSRKTTVSFIWRLIHSLILTLAVVIVHYFLFYVAGPRAWNNLAVEIKKADRQFH